MTIIEIIAEWIDRIMPLVSLLIAFASWSTGLLQSKIVNHFKTRKKSKLLSIDPKKRCEIVIPIRKGRLSQNHGDTSDPLNRDYHFITFDESKVMLELPKLLGNPDFILASSKIESDTQNNKFVIGGFLANEYVLHLLQGKQGVKFKNKLFRYSNETSLKHPLHQSCLDFLLPKVEGQHIVSLGKSKDQIIKDLEYDEGGDYVIWIKLSPKNFGQKNHGYIHIIWGDKASTPPAMIKFITHNADAIYDRLKKQRHLDHFVLFLKCTPNEEIDMNSLIDITDDML